MQDVVARVLEERDRHAGGVSTGLLVSAILHMTLFGFLLVNRQSTEEVDLAPALSIRLAPAPSTAAAPAVSAAAAAPAPVVSPPLPVPATPVAEPAPPVVVPAETKTSPAVTEKTLFGKQKAVVAEPVKPIRAEAAKPAAAVAQPKTATAAIPPAAGTASPLPALGEAGVASFEGGTVPAFYVQRMLALIGQHWFRPEAGDRITQVYFRIHRDGSINEVRTTKPSGSEAFDRAAQRAVIETSRLPALPFTVSGQYLGVNLTFH